MKNKINEKDISDDVKKKKKKVEKRSIYLNHNSSNSNDNLVNYNEKIVEKIVMSPIKIYLCCFFSRRIKNLNNLLMDKCIEIFTDKMNIFTIFKKSIYNEIILNKEPIVEIFDTPFKGNI